MMFASLPFSISIEFEVDGVSIGMTVENSKFNDTM